MSVYIQISSAGAGVTWCMRHVCVCMCVRACVRACVYYICIYTRSWGWSSVVHSSSPILGDRPADCVALVSVPLFSVFTSMPPVTRIVRVVDLCGCSRQSCLDTAYVSIRQHTSAYVDLCGCRQSCSPSPFASVFVLWGY